MMGNSRIYYPLNVILYFFHHQSYQYWIGPLISLNDFKTFIALLQDPTWNESFSFEVEKQHKFLNICLWSKSDERYSKDVLIGYVSLLDAVYTAIPFLPLYPLYGKVLVTLCPENGFEFDNSLQANSSLSKRLFNIFNPLFWFDSNP